MGKIPRELGDSDKKDLNTFIRQQAAYQFTTETWEREVGDKHDTDWCATRAAAGDVWGKLATDQLADRLATPIRNSQTLENAGIPHSRIWKMPPSDLSRDSLIRLVHWKYNAGIKSKSQTSFLGSRRDSSYQCGNPDPSRERMRSLCADSAHTESEVPASYADQPTTSSSKSSEQTKETALRSLGHRLSSKLSWTDRNSAQSPQVHERLLEE